MDDSLIVPVAALLGLVYAIAGVLGIMKALFDPDPLNLDVQRMERDICMHRQEVAEAEAYLAKLRSRRA